MAQRRMFSKTITQSSSFLMMPPTSRLLYYDLGMSADDDGFCEHYTVMKMTDAKPDDLKVLQAKGFVKVFDERVLVVLDWKENNYIQKDRYTPSKYLEVYKKELKQISADGKLLDTNCIQNGYTGKDRIGEDRIGKDTPPAANKVYSSQFNEDGSEKTKKQLKSEGIVIGSEKVKVTHATKLFFELTGQSEPEDPAVFIQEVGQMGNCIIRGISFDDLVASAKDIIENGKSWYNSNYVPISVARKHIIMLKKRRVLDSSKVHIPNDYTKQDYSDVAKLEDVKL
jgi:hypothetical protein